MVNALVLRKELEYITAHRNEWDQSRWLSVTRATACGTVGCLAGNAVLHAGWVPATVNGAVDVTQLSAETQLEYVSDGQHVLTVRNVARDELGLEHWQATLLFNGSNSLLTLWIIASLLTDEIEVPQSVIDDAVMPPSLTYERMVRYFAGIVRETRDYYERIEDRVAESLETLEMIEAFGDADVDD